MSEPYDAFEFTKFMEQYLKAHPEVVADKKRGWAIYWNPKAADQDEHPLIRGIPGSK